MFRLFLREDSGQGAIEYILLVGSIILAVVMIFAIYREMTSTAWVAVNATTNNASGQISDEIEEQIAGMRGNQ